MGSFRIDFLRFFPERIDDKYLLAFFDAPVRRFVDGIVIVLEKEHPPFFESLRQKCAFLFERREREVIVAHDPGQIHVRFGREKIGAKKEVAALAIVDMRKLLRARMAVKNF